MVSPASRLLSIAALAAVLFAAPTMALAQNGRIRGVVRDAHSSPLSGAVIRVAGPGPSRRATTGNDGSYVVTWLAAGPYTVSASLPGVRTQSKENVQVSAEGEAQVDFVLAALELEAITVTAMKREEQLINVPLSIAAPTEQALRVRGVDNIEQVAQNVAGFSVQNLGPGQSQPAIRGRLSRRIGDLAVAVHAGSRPVRRRPGRGAARSAGHAIRLGLASWHGALHQQSAGARQQ